MMTLAVVRRLPQLLELQRERTWQPLEASEMREKTVGVVGLGSIGLEVARLAHRLGATVIATRKGGADGSTASSTTPGSPTGAANRSSLEFVEGVEVLPAEALDDLLGRSDFIVLALPLTPETEDLFGTERLARVKPGAWLINIARGRLVNEQALLRALHDGPLGGAVLDTFREEPLPPESPLWGVPNLIVTPHTSWSSGRVLDRSVELFCDNLRRYSAGDALLNVVDWDKGY
jgi:phosphoglycerate dehydrogenase-like enzyme